MIKFPSIESYRHVVTRVRKDCDYHGWQYPILHFTGFVKLHGTNAGIRYNVATGEIVAQSRERELTLDSDNAGFCVFVERNKEAIKTAIQNYLSDDTLFGKVKDVVFFGEWVGPGVQKGVAISQIPSKCFVHIGTFIRSNDGGEIFDDPDLVPTFENIEQFETIANHKYHISIDFKNPDSALEELNRLTLQVETECPFTKNVFGISGIGEGIVWRCNGVSIGDTVTYQNPELIDHFFDTSMKFTFKTKGEKHAQGNAGKTNVSSNAKDFTGIDELVEKLLPAWRLEQAFASLGDSPTREQTGAFLKWLNQDILKEESDRIVESGFEVKDVLGRCSVAAKKFLFQKV